MPGKLTPTGRKALKRAAASPLGVNEWLGPHSFGFVQWEKMHQRLVGLGLMRAYPHGGYEITDAGRAALQQPQASPSNRKDGSSPKTTSTQGRGVNKP